MAEFIEVVIKMEKNEYLGIKSFQNNITSYPVTIHLYDAVRNGTPLPKNHGRLIDADELRCENADFDTYNDYCTMFDEIDAAETIIEADKAESEG